MLSFWPVYKRELQNFFQSSSTYIALALLFFLSGAVFHDTVRQFVVDSSAAVSGGPFGITQNPPNINTGIIEGIFNLLSFVILFSVPMLSMRLISAERSSGTFELIATCPISDWNILLGKYFALLSVGCVIVLLSSVYPITVYYFGRDQGAIPDRNIVTACYLGLFLIFAAYAAFGLMASAMTESQVTAAIVTLIGLLMWNALSELKMPTAGIQKITDQLSALRHTENFTAGFVSLSDITFFVLASFFCLFVAARVLEARRWRI